MNHSLSAHLKHMLLGAGGILVVQLVFGVPFGVALWTAVALACPIMMLGMLFGGGGQHAGHGAGHQRLPSQRPGAETFGEELPVDGSGRGAPTSSR